MQYLSLDTAKPIRYVSLNVQHGVWYKGLHFLDEDFGTIAQVKWDSKVAGEWLSPQEVPIGQQIVGFKCNTSSSDKVLRLAFVLGDVGHDDVADELNFQSVTDIFPSNDQLR